MNKDHWKNDSIQFPRLLAEIYAEGLTEGQIRRICASMALEPPQIEELFQRADKEFEAIKKHLDGSPRFDIATEAAGLDDREPLEGCLTLLDAFGSMCIEQGITILDAQPEDKGEDEE
jgi:hypothetical protein